MRDEPESLVERRRNSFEMWRQPAIGDSGDASAIGAWSGSKVGSPVNQVQASRTCHPTFGGAAAGDSGASGVHDKPHGAVASVLSCAKCHRPCKRLTKAAYCRSRHADIELAQQIREVQAENPGISAEALAYKIKDRAKLKRLTARVRRVLRRRWHDPG